MKPTGFYEFNGEGLTGCSASMEYIWGVQTNSKYVHVHVYLEPVCPLFLDLNPQKALSIQKQGSFRFQV